MNELKKYNWKVCVSCMTYNHAPYILDALNGFCMQETDFPFVCTIVDDASTDGEPEVIRSYLEENFNLKDFSVGRKEETDDFVLIFAQHKTNINCFFAVLFLKYNHYQLKKNKLPYLKEWRDNAQYLAICEGDDYWIDSSKLQCQVDFLDLHPDHSMCFHAHNNLMPNGDINTLHRYNQSLDNCPIRDMILIGGGYAKVNSMMFHPFLADYKEWTNSIGIGDLPFQLSLFVRGKVAYIDRVMSCYRVMSIGSWSATQSSSLKKMQSHNKKIIMLWNNFDKWTNYKYHSIIIQKLQINKKNYYKSIIFFFYSMLRNKIKKIFTRFQ